jgi:hypothetical protein
MLPEVVKTLSTAVSKIHISFDGWTTKGGKHGYLGVVAHFANASGVICDLPIALPQLAGAHTGEAMAIVVAKTLEVYGITYDRLGYFVLDNASNNDTAVAKLGVQYHFNPIHRRLRCSPHTLNLIGQAIIFGTNRDAYDNDATQHTVEEAHLQDWRQHGPLGVLVGLINHIKTPQQYKLFRDFQQTANAQLPAGDRLRVLEPVKPVVTRWNSYYAAFQRATRLQAAYNMYAEHHIYHTNISDRRAAQSGNKLPEAPAWMRSTGLTSADWAVITEYQECLEPLKLATERLEGRGKAGRYGAIYEVIPVFEYVLNTLEARVQHYSHVDFDEVDAPEDHLKINLKAAWAKADNYYTKLDQSPAYYAAVCLHPYYKYYCDNSWINKPEWLNSAKADFQRLWSTYKPQQPCPRQPTTTLNGIDDMIGAFVRRNGGRSGSGAAPDDEYERWKATEPSWSEEQYHGNGHPVQYWIQMSSKYPNLSRFAIDILTVPASSCDCERLFSELGDLLEPRRRALGNHILSTLQLIRSWARAGFKTSFNDDDSHTLEAELSDETMMGEVNIHDWHTTTL